MTSLPENPTDWGTAAWDMYVERAAIHEIETGLDPHTARIRAEQEVRAWASLGGDAALRALPPLSVASPPPRGRGANQEPCAPICGHSTRSVLNTKR